MGPGQRFLSNGPKWGQAGGLYEIGPGGLGPCIGRRQERLGALGVEPRQVYTAGDAHGTSGDPGSGHYQV